MEKRLRSSLQTSAEEFISAAAKLPLRSSTSAVKTLINSIKPSSDLSSTLPFALRSSISHCISQFKNLRDAAFTTSPFTPPAKRVRRSSRSRREDGVSPTKDGKNDAQSITEQLQVYAYILHLCAFHPKNVFPVADLLPAAQDLHDNMILFESYQCLLSEIAHLCEEWWKGDLIGKEALITQSLPVALSRSLTLKKKVDVHRIYTLRDAFTLFDFEDESIEDLKHLLLRCVLSPLFLKTEDGRKFVAFTAGLSVQLTKEVCAMIKSQIPFGRKSILEAYGEIIFRAWKAAEGECKDEIGNRFLQGLVEGAIYARSAELAASVRRVLGHFVNNRTTEGVEQLIFSLAEPVVFRSLQVANSNVRQNGLHLLLDLFPLEDPNATKEAKDTLLERQFFLLEKLLMDECPDVRLVAVEGCCRILNLFWEVIPSPTISKIITKIFDDMSNDACAEVRLSTISGVIYLLGNPQSHEVLKVLLPRLSKLILDSAAAVRTAIIDLLLLLNDIRNFHFHKVVSVDALLSLLANDQPRIGRKITRLLIPSYFPSKVTVEEACKRCITLIRRSPAAGAKFCEFAALEGASPSSLMKLFQVLMGLVLSSAKLDKELIEGSLLAASHLCTNLANDASFHSALKEELSIEKLKTLFSVASTSSAQSSVCNIISAMHLDSVGGLFEDCMDLITKFSDTSDNVERQAEMRSAHKMILSCGWFEDMLEALVGFLENVAWRCHVKFGIGTGEKKFKSAKRRKVKSSLNKSSRSKHSNGQKSSNVAKDSFLEDYAIADGVAWQIRDLLLSENTREAMLSSGILENAHSALKVISEACILHYDCMSTTPIYAYATLTLHMSCYGIKSYGSKDSSQATIIELTLEQLLHCVYNVMHSKKKSGNCSGSGNSGDNEELPTGTNLSWRKISNVVKVLSAVLKFAVDAASMNLAPQHQESCLSFAIENLKFIIMNIRECYIAQLQFTDKDVREIFICLKSSFTYGAKLLNIVLTTCETRASKREAYNLANELLNLFISVEEFLGYGYATRLIPVIQPWIPDLVLALGSDYLIKQTSVEEGDSDSFENPANEIPSWCIILASMELHEQRNANSEEEETNRVRDAMDFSAFKRLFETMARTLKLNNKILDAVGAILLTGSANALRNKKFDVVFGLLHFVCAKLVSPDYREWEELETMLASLEEIYSEVETQAQDPSNNESDKQKLESVITLLRPVWT